MAAEGTCDHLMKDRMERKGMRWTVSGPKSKLHLRAIHINRSWKSYVTNLFSQTPKTMKMLRTVDLLDHPATGDLRGHLHLCSMPGRFESMDVFFREIEEAGVDHVLCLVSDDEISRKSPNYLVALQAGGLQLEGRQVDVLRCEIPDYGILKKDTLVQTLDEVISYLKDGKSVVIHCAAGHGRTGMVSVLLLARMSVPLERAMEIIRHAGSAADTQEQEDFVRRLANRWISTTP